MWKINYHLASSDSIGKLYSDYNSFYKINGFGEKYEFGNAQMFAGLTGLIKLEILLKETERLQNIKSYLSTVL